MSRFGEVNKREGLQFDYEAYDVIRFSNGSIGIITDYGIYDNQYWCEVIYPQRCELSLADYFLSFAGNCNKFYILEKVNDKAVIKDAKEKYLKALIEYNENLSKEYQDEINNIQMTI